MSDLIQNNVGLIVITLLIVVIGGIISIRRKRG